MKFDQDGISETESAERQSASRLFESKLMAWTAVLVWMLVIFLFSAQPHSGEQTHKLLGDANIPIRKIAHMTEYAILLLLYRHAWKLSFPIGFWSRYPGVVALVFAFLYAASDEWHQTFVPGRSAQFSDVLVDTSGAVVGLVLCLLNSKLISKVNPARLETDDIGR